MKVNQREEIWREIFDGEKIPQSLDARGFAILTAATIKNKYHQEPRLLAKIDAAEYLPEVFAQHDAAILSRTNSEYVIMRLGDKGKPLFPSLRLKDMWRTSPVFVDFRKLQRQIATIPWEKHFTSESQALDAAVAAHILQNFVGEGQWQLTIRGRRRFQGEVPLRFRVGRNRETRILEFPAVATGFQFEVDGGYEAPRHVYLIEAKNKIQETFNLRQVVFPYLFWTRYLRTQNVAKGVRPIFLLYTAHHYLLVELQVEEEDILNAVTVRRQGWYVLGEPLFSHQQILEITHRLQPRFILDVPFPQADLLLRVYSLLEDLDQEAVASGEDIAEAQRFHPRQGDYYANAARWLGWVTKVNGVFALTPQGKKVVRASFVERVRLTLETLAQRPVFHTALRWWATHGDVPPRQEIQGWIMKASERGQIKKSMGESTAKRRSQTVRRWLMILAPWVRS